VNLKDYIKLTELAINTPLGLVIPQPVFGALPTSWTGSIADTLPLRSGGFAGKTRDFDLNLPTTTKNGIINYINNKVNPIFIHLSDGTRLYIPYDAFKKIKDEPKIGKTMIVVLQRRPEDGSLIPSQVQSIRCY
jgi:hypothetical protein